MGDSFYLYGIIYILKLLYNFYERSKNKGKEEDVVIDLSNISSTLNKIIKPDFIWAIINVIWLIGGLFSDEKIFFMVLLFFFNLILPIMMIVTKNSNSSKLFIINHLCEMFITIIMINHHFFFKH